MRRIFFIFLIFILLLFPACDCRIVNGQFEIGVLEDACYGNITPCINDTYNIGSSSSYWNTLYVTRIIGWPLLGGNVTATGTSAGHIPYFSTSTNLQNSSMYYSTVSGYIGIFDNTPSTQLDVTGVIHATGDINSDSDINSGNDVNVTNDLDVTDDADIGGDIRVVGAGSIGGLSVYANNAAAVAGGLGVGDLYRTGGDPDLVCVVH